MANKGFDATRGRVGPNRGGTHGGINPAGGKGDESHTTEGSSGNPGLENPWEGADATAHPGQVPPLKSLGNGQYGNP